MRFAKLVRQNVGLWALACVFLFLPWLTVSQQTAFGQQQGRTQPNVTHSQALHLQLSDESSRPLMMVAGDFDEDGVSDLLVGYGLSKGGSVLLLRGNLDAIAPQTQESWVAAGHGEYAARFLEKDRAVPVQQEPDLMASADVNGDGHLDLIYASTHGNQVNVMLGDGKGKFLAPIGVSVGGNITALAAYRPGAPLPGEAIVVGYQASKGAGLAILSYSSKALVARATYPLPGAATAMTVANLDADRVPDTAIVAGGNLLILHGRAALSGNSSLTALPVSDVTSVTAGEFLFDRHAQMQLAALTASGDVVVLAHDGFDPTPYTSQQIAEARRAQRGRAAAPTLSQQAGNTGSEPWVQVETNSGVGAQGFGDRTPILLRSRASGSGGDDLVVVNSAQRQSAFISHPVATSQSAPASATSRVMSSSLATGNVVAAIALPVSPDARQGLVLLSSDDISPEITLPSAGNTFYVNAYTDNTGSTTDPSDGIRCTEGSGETCTLRDAITFANSDAADNGSSSSDTILLPSGTYTLTWQAGVTDGNTNAVTHLEILGPMTIIGSTSGGGTIINAENNDTVFTINPGPFGSFNPSGDSYVFDTKLENLVIENGTNTNNLNNSGLANYVGGCLNWDAFGAGNLTLINTTIENCTALWGPGGGLWAQNSAGGGTGTLTMSGGSISNNSTPELGGGLQTAYPPAALSITGTTITGNKAQISVNSSDGDADGAGGGLYLDGRQPPPATPQSTLTGVTISSNIAANDDGGGIATFSGILLSGSVLSGNSSGGSGGGIWSNSAGDGSQTTITSSNLVSNSAANTGGAIALGLESQAEGNILQVSLSRIFGNTAVNGASGLADGISGEGAGEAIATENWWGCNGGPTDATCDQAVLYNGGGSLFTAPYAELGFSSNTTSIAEGDSANLTVSLNKDSNSDAISGAFPAVATNYPYTFNVSGINVSPALTTGTFDTDGVGTATLTPTSTGNGTVTVTFDNQTIPINFTVTASVAVTAISPASGLLAGGNSVTITGTDFTGVTAVNFGAVPATSFTVISATQITATAPAGSAGTVNITVTTGSGTSATGATDQYTYVAAPTVTGVSPTNGATAGGNTVTITGTSLTGATAVIFGAVPASNVTVNSATQITATAPAGSAGTVNITVTTGGGTSATGPADQYTYVAAPTVTSIAPASGATAGGNTVTVIGSNFTGATAVRFGATSAASFTVNSATQITATAPGGSAGPVNITVTTGGGTSATSAADQYTYVAAPTVTGVSPTSGATAGGNTVTITGTSLTGATAVSFGAAPAISYTVNSATQITATAPAGATGTVNITVTTGGGTSATSAADQYTYVAAPTVTGISPASGPTAGGTVVTIAGSNFTGATAVRFGAISATSYTVNSATRITATAPAGSAGSVDITVTTVGGTSGTSAADLYSYAAVPNVTAISPTSGPTAGGTPVTITGANLTGATAVSFGGVPATSILVNSATQITATAPAGAAGPVNITVTTVGGTSATSAADVYTYVAQAFSPTNSSLTLSPATIVAGASTTVTATVEDATGNPINGATVNFTVSSTSNNAQLSSTSGTTVNGVATVQLTDSTTETVTVGASVASPYSGQFALTTGNFVAPAYVVTVLTDEASGVGVAGNCIDPNISTEGNTNCSLRDAIAAANALTAVTTSISFAPALTANATPTNPATLTLGGTQLTLSQGASILGPDAHLLSISGNIASRILQVNSGVNASLSGLTLSGGAGSSGGSGGAIESAGLLTVTNSAFSTNQVSSGDGGAIYSTGPLTVTHSTFSTNQAINGSGGAIYSAGPLTVTNSTFTTNQVSSGSGGAIYAAGPLTLTNSTFSANQASGGSGGAIYATVALAVTNSTFSTNSAGMGSSIYTSGQLNVQNSIFSDAGNSISGSYTDNGGNLFDVPGLNLAALGNYGGPTQTLLPLPGSAAICAGVAPTQATLPTDQRGDPRPDTYGSTTCYDSGAVQTGYTLAFTTQPPSTVYSGATISPAPAVTLSENGAPLNAASAGISIAASEGTLSGATSANTTNGLATFSSVSISPAETNDTLIATLALTGSINLTATSDAFNVFPAFTATQAIASEVLTQNREAAPFTPVTGSGGDAPLTYSVSPALPTGLSMASATGTITGTSTVTSAARTYTVTVTDANNATATATFSLTVDGAVAATQAVAATTLTVFEPATAFLPVRGSGGDAPLSYSVSPTLPMGLSIAAATGTITGTPSMVSAGGTYTVTVTDANNATATATFTVSVAKQGSITTLTANPTSVTPVQAVTLTATVAPAATGTPTGTVTFFDNGTQLGASVPLTGNTAQLVVPGLLSGQRTITAVYSGDNSFLTSTSSTGAVVNVTPLDFSFTASGATNQTIIPGSTASFVFTLTPTYAVYPGPVSFTVSGLPPGASYTTSVSTVGSTAGAQSITLTIQTASATAHSTVQNSGRSYAPLALGLLLPLLGSGRLRPIRRKLSGAISLVLLLATGFLTISALSGCGSANGFFAQPQRTYAVTITATSGAVQHTVVVNLQVE